MGTVGAKKPRTRTLAFRCGPDLQGRLAGTDFTMEDSEVHETVPSSNRNNG